MHGMLVRVDTTLVVAARDPGRLNELRQEFEHLSAPLESHFAYEEEQIGLPLGLHGVMV